MADLVNVYGRDLLGKEIQTDSTWQHEKNIKGRPNKNGTDNELERVVKVEK